MREKKICFSILFFFVVVKAADAGLIGNGPYYNAEDEVPSWPLTYTVQGTVSIPFAEIREPFLAWYDGQGQRSRIDYYGGMDKTFQIGGQGPKGQAFKVVPMTNEIVANRMSCFTTNGTDDAVVTATSVLPDLKGFKMIGYDSINGQNCEKWQSTEKIGHKVNKYTVWLTVVKSTLNPKLATAIPVRYRMKGYNSLLGSHYDHYYVSYQNFVADVSNPKVFDEYKKAGPCTGWPGPGLSDSEHIYLMDPMREFIHGHTAHVDSEFDGFKDKHGKNYQTASEQEEKKDVFRQNLRFIHSHNRKHLSFKLASNHLADWTEEERKSLRGKLYTPGYNGGQPFTYTEREVADAPASLDWRLYGAVSPVKDQSMCGSCWSFGSVGTLEGANFLHNGGEMVRLSQQALMDCSWGFGNNGCDGGEDWRVYNFMMKHGGIPSEDAYGPYLGQDGFCHLKDVEMAFSIDGFVNVTTQNPDALKVAIAKHGPISVAVDAAVPTFSFYSSGVYFEPDCKNTTTSLDHAVLAVGYGELEGQEYWLIKNSWSTHWGNDGYILISQRDNDCGVTDTPTFVIPSKKQPKKDQDEDDHDDSWFGGDDL